MPSKPDSKPKPEATATAPTPPAQPGSAPEIDQTLLSLVQKQRIEAEFGPEPMPAQQVVTMTSVPTPPARTAPDTKLQPLASDMAEASASLKAEVAAEPVESDKLVQALAKPEPASPVPKPHRLRRWFGRHKKLWLLVLLAVLLGGLAAVPYTRYILAGYVIKQPFSVTVTDAVTKRPVSSATVTIDGQRLMTDKDGRLRAAGVRPGPQAVAVSKKYYRDASATVNVPLYGGKGQAKLVITATGRQVPVTVVNKLTGKPLENVSLKAVGTEVKTGKDGKAALVVPADKPTLEVALVVTGFNGSTARLTVTDQAVKQNNFALVPAGKLYFLSRQSGKLDVVRTNLDGSDRQTVVYGTGKEDDRTTSLLASRDWKFLALYSKRETGPAKLYLVDTATDKLTTIDDSGTDLRLTGWSEHNFVYLATRSDDKPWLPGHQTVKSYNADKRQSLTMDQSQAEGDQASNKFQLFGQPYLASDRVVYPVNWFSYSGNDLADRTDTVRSVVAGTQTKKDLRVWPAVQYGAFESRAYEPGGIYFAAYSVVDNKYDFFAYEAGQIKDASLERDSFFSANYPTYLQSPSGSQTYWSEQRDGRASLLVGDAGGKNGKQVAAIEDGAAYGWYGNEYLLASKNGRELLILPVTGGTPLKVADYHKPEVTYRGYGGGYGGL